MVCLKLPYKICPPQESTATEHHKRAVQERTASHKCIHWENRLTAKLGAGGNVKHNVVQVHNIPCMRLMLLVSSSINKHELDLVAYT